MKDKVSHDTFVEQISLESGFDIDTSHNFVSELFTLMRERILTKDEVGIRNFGTFKMLWHDHKDGVNPQTKDKLTIPAHYAIHFHPAKKLVTSVNQEQGYLPVDDFSSHAYLGLKHYASIAVAAVAVVFLLFLLPKSQDVKIDNAINIVELTVPHSKKSFSYDTIAKSAVQTIAKKDHIALDTEMVAMKIDTDEKSQKVRVPEHTSYSVNKFDSLSVIAKTHYGHAEFWPLIYVKNKGLIKDPDRIYIGTKLIIPSIDDRKEEAKKVLANAYLLVYKAYQSLGKVKTSQWALWMGVTKIDDCLLSAYSDQIEKRDILAVNHFLACNTQAPVKDRP